jgi:hypothetical protein
LIKFIQEKTIEASPDSSRNKPSRHENGTTVSAWANRSLAFSKLPGTCFSTEAIKKIDMSQRFTLPHNQDTTSKRRTIISEVMIILLANFALTRNATHKQWQRLLACMYVFKPVILKL